MLADPGERGPALLESVLGATPQEFESPILRFPDLRRRAWVMFACCANAAEVSSGGLDRWSSVGDAQQEYMRSLNSAAVRWRPSAGCR